MKNSFKHKFNDKIVTAIQFKAKKCDFYPLFGDACEVVIERLKDNNYSVIIKDRALTNSFNLNHNDWVIQDGVFNFVIIPSNYFNDLFEKYAPSLNESGNFFDTILKTWVYVEQFQGTIPKFIELFNVDVTIETISNDYCMLTYNGRTITLRRGEYWVWDGGHYQLIGDTYFRFKASSN
jgi:hypothetical protein